MILEKLKEKYPKDKIEIYVIVDPETSICFNYVNFNDKKINIKWSNLEEEQLLDKKNIEQLKEELETMVLEELIKEIEKRKKNEN